MQFMSITVAPSASPHNVGVTSRPLHGSSISGPRSQFVSPVAMPLGRPRSGQLWARARRTSQIWVVAYVKRKKKSDPVGVVLGIVYDGVTLLCGRRRSTYVTAGILSFDIVVYVVTGTDRRGARILDGNSDTPAQTIICPPLPGSPVLGPCYWAHSNSEKKVLGPPCLGLLPSLGLRSESQSRPACGWRHWPSKIQCNWDVNSGPWNPILHLNSRRVVVRHVWSQYIIMPHS